MLEGKCETNRVPKDIELTPQKKNRSELEQNKDSEKKMENQRKNDEKKKDE